MSKIFKAIKIGLMILDYISFEKLEEIRDECRDVALQIKKGRDPLSPGGRRYTIKELKEITKETWDVVEAVVPGYKDVKDFLEEKKDEEKKD